VKLVVRRKAAEDLQHIFEYISRDSPQSARRVVNRIRDGVRDSLMMFPEMGRRGLVAGTREWHIPDLPYIVIYKVDPGRTRLDVLAIYHGAQDR
jgi:addiction module RelE/StbE family toxin